MKITLTLGQHMIKTKEQVAKKLHWTKGEFNVTKTTTVLIFHNVSKLKTLGW